MDNAALEAEVSRLRGENATLTIERNHFRSLSDSLREANLQFSVDLVRTATDLREVNTRVSAVLARVRGR